MATTLDEQTRRPFLARWEEVSEAAPGSTTSMNNPDTSTYRRDTEDNDT